MAEFEDIEFVIPGHTPETMPLDRLIDYLRQFAALVGEPAEMHLVRIEASSTKPVFRMPLPAANRVRERISTVRAGRGTRDQSAALNRLRRMVQQDGGEPALVESNNVVLLSVQPLPSEEGAVIGVRQQTQFDGILLRVGGSGDDIPVLMQDFSGTVVAGVTAQRGIAKAMASHLFDPLRVFGVGSWDRDASGEWSLNRMQIRSFDILKDEDAGAVLTALNRADVSWPADFDQRIDRERADTP